MYQKMESVIIPARDPHSDSSTVDKVHKTLRAALPPSYTHASHSPATNRELLDSHPILPNAGAGPERLCQKRKSEDTSSHDGGNMRKRLCIGNEHPHDEHTHSLLLKNNDLLSQNKILHQSATASSKHATASALALANKESETNERIAELEDQISSLEYDNEHDENLYAELELAQSEIESKAEEIRKLESELRGVKRRNKNQRDTILGLEVYLEGALEVAGKLSQGISEQLEELRS